MKFRDYFTIVFFVLFYCGLVALLLAGCAQIALKNGDSTATYKGVKVFSPTVFSLRSGHCAVPSVDAAGIVIEPASAPAMGTATPASPLASDCTTAVASVNGVDVKGLVNVILSSVLAGIAAG